MVGVLHIIVHAPRADALRPHVRDVDVVLDLTLRPISSPSLRDEIPSRPRWIRGAVEDEEVFRRAREICLDEHARLFGAEGPVTTMFAPLAHRDELGWQWFLPFARKFLISNDWPWLVQRLTWVSSRREAGELDELRGRPCCLWVADRRAGDLIEGWLASELECTTVVRRSSETGAEMPPRRPVARCARMLFEQLVEAPLRQARLVLGLARWQLGERPKRSRDDVGAARPRVLIAMDAASWVSDPQWGGWENRYTGDFPDRLAERGHSVAWLPTIESAEGLRRQAAALGCGEQRATWEALPNLIPLALRAWGGVARSQARFLWTRPWRRAHGASLLGQDVSGVLVDEMSDHLARRALNYAILHDSIRASVAALDPDAIIYRNEFYPFGLAVSAATYGLTRRCSFQHGTITRDHLSYYYRGALFRAEAGGEHMPAPDSLLTYGPGVNEELSAEGYPAHRLAAVGSLRHDVQIEEQVRVHGRSRDGEGALVVCGTLPQLLPEWLERLVGGIRMAGVSPLVVVKPHPRYEQAVDVHQVMRSLGYHRFELVSGPLDPLFRRGDVVLTDVSTTGLEAAIHGVPLICFAEGGHYERMPFVSEGLALPAADAAEMATALRRTLSPTYRAEWEERRVAYLRRHLANFERPAVEALSQLLTSQHRSEAGGLRARNHN